MANPYGNWSYVSDQTQERLTVKIQQLKAKIACEFISSKLSYSEASELLQLDQSRLKMAVEDPECSLSQLPMLIDILYRMGIYVEIEVS